MTVGLLTWTLIVPLVAFVLTVLLPSSQTKAIKSVNALAGVVSMGLAIKLWFAYDKALGGLQFVEDMPWIDGLHIRYQVGADGVTVVMVLLTALVFLAGSLTMWTLEKRVKEYFAFVALLVFGVFGVFVALDVFAFFFFYEVAVLPMYPLIAVWGSTNKEHSAMKLTLYLMAGSALLFPALIALFVAGGGETWNMQALTVALADQREMQIYLYPFIYIGFGILAGMFPFHGWSPSGHVAAPTSVSMLHAGVLMKLGAFGILRIGIQILPEGAAYWAPTFAVFAGIGVVYGAFVAMRQTDFKFIIGFSSVSHMGLVLLGLNTLTADGMTGAVFQMFAHGVMTALFFSSVGFIYDQTHDRDIRHFGGLSSQVPVASGFFIAAALCGVGVPGFASFWAELYVFWAALMTFPLIGVAAIVGLVFTALYGLRMVGTAMFGPPNPDWASLKDQRPWDMIPRSLLVGTLVLFGLIPTWILDMIQTFTERL